MSAIVNQMLGEAKNQAQAIINKTLIESKKDLQEAITQTVQTRTANIKAQLEPSIERARQAAYISLMAGCVAVLASGIAFWAAL
ncbi:hypothetical protein [Ventosimonas gracilis]